MDASLAELSWDEMAGVAQAAPASATSVLQVRDLEKRFGGTVVLSDCTIDVAEGEIVTLLGPSGCGKTTLLRCIAGFWEPDGGAISIDGRNALPIPVNRRPVGVVFQSYALFPHMTVAQNVGYGLRMRGVPKRQIAEAVARILDTVALGAFADRWPAQLSGGQQQRVAVARVLVLEPRVLLLDEPFSALDAKLRGAMQMDLRQLIKRLGITAIFVTHDQEEALIMSDRIAVMRQGRIEQIAAPEEVFDHPATAYVADFVGASNFWAASAENGKVVLSDGSTVATKLTGPVRAMSRPHNIRLEAGHGGPWTGTITLHRPVGPLVDYVVRTMDGIDIKVSALRQEQARILADGAEVTLSLRDPSLCAIYPAD
jgi:ABC-type Fe3+/spermidine/putrescine transport system ATPase subunit